MLDGTYYAKRAREERAAAAAATDLVTRDSYLRVAEQYERLVALTPSDPQRRNVEPARAG
jgi:uncharacterized protein YciW